MPAIHSMGLDAYCQIMNMEPVSLSIRHGFTLSVLSKIKMLTLQDCGEGTDVGKIQCKKKKKKKVTP